ncbi:hypothetical protein AK812_SmicGene20127 [Symbiodinium microadriaticum]|uniref:Uncharacterized protein n=1 Tax=Symbiodinium microadriaticum TaxID=2951 RepID=A0A1Q9DQV3_SYMMI|nr:hypothetical protein AK812_SmicGene20127 [Symbiodinium microadriaticum]
MVKSSVACLLVLCSHSTSGWTACQGWQAAGHGLELSWEELKFALSHFFEVQEDEWIDALHAQNGESLMQMQYTCIYFKATRNTTPVPGIGK